MACLGAGREDAVAEIRAAMAGAAIGQGTNAMMSRDVGLPVADAMIAFARGDHAATVALLMPVRILTIASAAAMPSAMSSR